MAEVDTSQTQPEPTDSKPAFDEAKMQELIKQNISSSMKEALEASRVQEQSRQVAQQEPAKTQDPDFWADIIDPRVDKKVATASLLAEAAEDKVDFYSSEDWLTEADEWLTEEDPDKRKLEKAELRKKVEETFSTLLKSGRGTRRTDVFKYVLGEKISTDRKKYVESIGKKHSRSKELELTKAQRGVDVSAGNISNFDAQSVHKMPFDKVIEEYGNLAF